MNDQMQKRSRQALEKYTIDLTARAESGKLDPVVGVMKKFVEPFKYYNVVPQNNPVLIGEPGVGEKRRLSKAWHKAYRKRRSARRFEK